MMNIRQIRTTVSYQTHFLCTNTKIPKWNIGDCSTARRCRARGPGPRRHRIVGTRRPDETGTGGHLRSRFPTQQLSLRNCSDAARTRSGEFRKAPRALPWSAVHFTCSPFAAKTWTSSSSFSANSVSPGQLAERKAQNQLRNQINAFTLNSL